MWILPSFQRPALFIGCSEASNSVTRTPRLPRRIASELPSIPAPRMAIRRSRLKARGMPLDFRDSRNRRPDHNVHLKAPKALRRRIYRSAQTKQEGEDRWPGRVGLNRIFPPYPHRLRQFRFDRMRRLRVDAPSYARGRPFFLPPLKGLQKTSAAA